MRKALLAAITVLVFFSLVVSVSGSETWIQGTIAGAITQHDYGPSYDQFFFSIADSSDPSRILTNVTVVAVNGTIPSSQIVVGSSLNLTGVFAFGDPNGVPDGYFVAINVNQNSTVFDWRSALSMLIGDITSIGKLLVTFVVQLVQSLTGIVLPTWTVALILVISAMSFVLTWFNKLPKILIGIVFLICVAVLMYALTPL